MTGKELKRVNVDYSLDYKMKKAYKVLTRGKLKLERKGCVKVGKFLKRRNN